MSTKISSSNIQASALVIFSKPKVISIAYPGTDTAVDPAGAQTITLTGSGFVSGLVVYIGGSIVGVSSVVSSTQVTFVTPVKAAGNYTLTVVNADGGTATFVPGIQYSGVPAWTTSAGSLGTIYEAAAISSSLTAISDSAVSYTVSAGTIPATTALNTSTGVLSGTAPVVASPTTYNFTVTAKDAEDQDTARNFSYTVNPDSVTWGTPAGATLSGTSGTAYTQALSATSAAGRAITYTANALPAGLSISGASITGTPSAISSISTLLTATSATTSRTSTKTVAWSIVTGVAIGQQLFYIAGTFGWIAPAGVTSICVVAVGGGGAGGGWNGGTGGGLGWKNNIPVTPGTNYLIRVGAGGEKLSGMNQPGSAGGDSYFVNVSTVKGGGGAGAAYGYTITTPSAGGTYTGDGGGAGGISGIYASSTYGGGGGAGGYAGAGGRGNNGTSPGQPGNGGGGGGGSSTKGGGVGMNGQGANGAGGGGGGSGGTAGGYGAGSSHAGGTSANSASSGAVRIIWGPGRAFPSTNTADQ